MRYCAGLTELCGPAPVPPVRRPGKGEILGMRLCNTSANALRIDLQCMKPLTVGAGHICDHYYSHETVVIRLHG